MTTPDTTIKRHPDGSLDIRHYQIEGRRLRSRAFFCMLKSLHRRFGAKAAAADSQTTCTAQ